MSRCKRHQCTNCIVQNAPAVGVLQCKMHPKIAHCTPGCLLHPPGALACVRSVPPSPSHHEGARTCDTLPDQNCKTMKYFHLLVDIYIYVLISRTSTKIPHRSEPMTIRNVPNAAALTYPSSKFETYPSSNASPPTLPAVGQSAPLHSAHIPPG